MTPYCFVLTCLLHRTEKFAELEQKIRFLRTEPKVTDRNFKSI